MTDDVTIPRGADLTDEDLDILADDAAVVLNWCMRVMHLPRDHWNEQFKQAFMVRLGRREKTR